VELSLSLVAVVAWGPPLPDRLIPAASPELHPIRSVPTPFVGAGGELWLVTPDGMVGVFRDGFRRVFLPDVERVVALVPLADEILVLGIHQGGNVLALVEKTGARWRRTGPSRADTAAHALSGDLEALVRDGDQLYVSAASAGGGLARVSLANGALEPIELSGAGPAWVTGGTIQQLISGERWWTRDGDEERSVTVDRRLRRCEPIAPANPDGDGLVFQDKDGLMWMDGDGALRERLPTAGVVRDGDELVVATPGDPLQVTRWQGGVALGKTAVSGLSTRARLVRANERFSFLDGAQLVEIDEAGRLVGARPSDELPMETIAGGIDFSCSLVRQGRVVCVGSDPQGVFVVEIGAPSIRRE
jgi:hypothetical protein